MIRKLTKAVAAKDLGVSVRTLERKIAAGLYRVERGAPNRLGKRAVLVIMPEQRDGSNPSCQPEQRMSSGDIRPEVIPFADVPLHPVPESTPIPEPETFDPVTFVDSFGNTLSTPNERYLAGFRPEIDNADAIVPAVTPIRRVGVPQVHVDCTGGTLPSGYGVTQADLDAWVTAHPRGTMFSR